ncbi:MAG: ATP-grasp domain-containing protein [Gemmatimonadaceae bacterium]|jgi:phosphoribosylaminoimidazole carboxylase (NCAIR synthetase)|nr:ATP-grasp domain-containing protein [Gemmatimonadaceae bacterium]
MPFVIFTAPWFTPGATQMIEAAASLPGVRLAVIAQDPLERLPAELQQRLAGHWRVDDVLDANQLEHAVRHLTARHGAPHRLFGAFEQLQQPLADVREALNLQGMRPATARRFRDKAHMKDTLRAAGIPCARHKLATNSDDAWRFVQEAGFPLVAKPPAGAGAKSTYRLDDDEALRDLLDRSPPTADDPMLLEEFLVGSEHSFETISIRGRAVWHSLTHYYPTPLEVVEHPWIQWCVVLPREVDEPQFDDIRDAGARALDALGMDTGLTHMEWFRRKDGTLAISEVAARPPGAQITTMNSRAHDFDFVRAWTNVMINEEFDPPTRKYAVGTAFLRGQGEGRVRRVVGLDQVRQELGSLVTDWRLPFEGQTPTGSYEGEGFIVLRHPETAVVTEALSRLISVVRVELG